MDEKELIAGTDDAGLISDINVTPFIDIMLVLLVIFMVTAPLMLGGVHVNLPKSGGDPMPRPENPLIVSLDAQSRVFVDQEEVLEIERPARFKNLAQKSESGEVFVRGDGEVKYARMMELMGALGQAGFARVTLVTDVRNTIKTHGERHGSALAAATAPAEVPANSPAPATNGHPRGSVSVPAENGQVKP